MLRLFLLFLFIPAIAHAQTNFDAYSNDTSVDDAAELILYDSAQAPAGMRNITWGAVKDLLVPYTGASGAVNLNGQGLTNVGALQTQAPSAATVASIFKGASSQTANLTEWQDSSGIIRAKVQSDGVFKIGGTGKDGSVIFGRAFDGGVTGAVGITGQLTFLQEKQGSGGILQSYDGGYALHWRRGGAGDHRVAINAPNFNLADAQLDVHVGSAANVGVIVKGAASQTGNLTEWQDSSGTVLSAVDEDGKLIVGAGLNSGTAALTIYDNSYDFLDMRRNSPNDLSVLKFYSTGDFTNTYMEAQGQSLLNYYRTNKVLIVNSDDITSTISDNDGTSVTDGVIMPHTSFYGDSSVSFDMWTQRGTSGTETPRAQIIAVEEPGDRAGGLEFWTSADAVGFTDMNLGLFIDSAGLVGINNASPAGQLDVAVESASTVGSIIKGAVSQSADLQQWQNSAGTVVASINSGGVLTALQANNYINSIRNTGTMSWYQPFTQSTNNASLFLTQSGTLGGSAVHVNNVNFSHTVNQSGTAGYTGFLLNSTETALGSGANLLMDLQAGSGGTTSMFSVSNTGDTIIAGNVGIGETSPNALLHLSGSDATIQQDVSAAAAFGGLTVYDDSGVLAMSLQFGNGSVSPSSLQDNIFFGGRKSGTDTIFISGSGVNERMRILDTGNIGIGIAAPDTVLDVNGAITARELSADPANPDEGAHVMWQSDGTGSGDDGDIMIKITAGASTKTITLIDFSTF